jgi:hypothetical protein
LGDLSKARVSWWSIAYWLALLVAAVFLVLFAIKRHELALELGRKKAELATIGRELARSRDELARSRREVERISLEANATRSGTLYLVSSMNGAQTFVGDLRARLDSLCQISEATPADILSFCRDLAVRAAWLQSSNEAAMQRAVALTESDFEQVARAYGGLLAAAGNNRQQVAFSQEGIAYARLRQRRLSEAAGAAAAARSADGNFTLAAITSIKISCAQEADAAQIRAALQALRARVRSIIQNMRAQLARSDRPFPALQLGIDYAEAERRLIEQDPELYAACRDAGVRPQA